jgi:hypothetical protein
MPLTEVAIRNAKPSDKPRRITDGIDSMPACFRSVRGRSAGRPPGREHGIA